MAAEVPRGDAPLVVDLDALQQVAEQGIVSRVVVENEHHKVVHFTFAPGQELSEHTASVPAVIQILDGEGTVRLGGDDHRARRGDALLHDGRAAPRHPRRRHPDDAAHHVPDLSGRRGARGQLTELVGPGHGVRSRAVAG